MRGLLAAVVVFGLCAAPAQAQRVRLAAPADCLVNAGCGVGLASVYGLQASTVFVALSRADAGIGALDDGTAEVAVAFSSNPALSRPDIVTLRDDRKMIFRDRVVPVVRSGMLRAYGRRAGDIRRRLNAASATLSTLALRGLNQAVIDGRTPEEAAAEYVDANGLGGVGTARRSGPRIVVAFQRFDENRTLAHLYAEALRAGGYRVVVRSSGGLRPEAVARLRRDRIDLYPDYDGSLLRYLVGTTPERLAAGLRHTLGRIDAEPMRYARAQDRNVFVTKTSTAAALRLSRISDLKRYWPAA